MRSVTLKSAMTPSFMGRMATMFPGVRPNICLASLPTARTSPLVLLLAARIVSKNGERMGCRSPIVPSIERGGVAVVTQRRLVFHPGVTEGWMSRALAYPPQQGILIKGCQPDTPVL